MKKFLGIFAVSIAMAAGYAHASVEFDPNSLGTPADCYNATPGDLSRELSVSLCMGATSAAPADCYKATPSDLTPELSVELCRHATSLAPVDCYKATPGDLTRELSVQLCKAENQLPHCQ